MPANPTKSVDTSPSLRPAMLAVFGLLALLSAAPAFSQSAPPPAAAAAATPPPDQAPPPLTAEQIDTLTAPIALYPDALLAQILMASAYPLDVVAADRFMQKNGTLTGDKMEQALAGQPWDISIKTLTHFPAILKYMDDNLDWTQALGDAFVNQQSDVMASIQRLRSEAYAVGNLKTSPQQTVTVDDNKNITIEPSDGQTIYVPQYDPNVVYTQGPATVITNGGTTTVVTQPSTTTVITQPTTTVVTQPGYSSTDLAVTGLLSFGAGILVGSLISDNCDWNHGYVYAPTYVNHWSGWGAPPPGWHNNGWNNNIHYGNNNININNDITINGGNRWKPDNTRRPSQGNLRPGASTRPAAGNNGFGKGQQGGGVFGGAGSNLGTQKNSLRGQQSLGGIKPGAGQGAIKPGAGQGGIKPGAGQGGIKPGAGQGGIKPGATQGGIKPGAGQGGFKAGGSTGSGGVFSGSGGGGGFTRNAGTRGGGSMGSAQRNGFKPPAGGGRRK